jgi:hypothetical protein
MTFGEIFALLGALCDNSDEGYLCPKGHKWGNDNLGVFPQTPRICILESVVWLLGD